MKKYTKPTLTRPGWLAGDWRLRQVKALIQARRFERSAVYRNSLARGAE